MKRVSDCILSGNHRTHNLSIDNGKVVLRKGFKRKFEVKGQCKRDFTSIYSVYQLMCLSITNISSLSADY